MAWWTGLSTAAPTSAPLDNWPAAAIKGNGAGKRFPPAKRFVGPGHGNEALPSEPHFDGRPAAPPAEALPPRQTFQTAIKLENL